MSRAPPLSDPCPGCPGVVPWLSRPAARVFPRQIAEFPRAALRGASGRDGRMTFFFGVRCRTSHVACLMLFDVRLMIDSIDVRSVPGLSRSGAVGCGCFWLLLVAVGCFWLLLVAFGCFWLLLAAFGCVFPRQIAKFPLFVFGLSRLFVVCLLVRLFVLLISLISVFVC